MHACLCRGLSNCACLRATAVSLPIRTGTVRFVASSFARPPGTTSFLRARTHTHTHTHTYIHIRIICQAPSNRNIAPIISLADPGPHFYLHQFPHHSLVSLCPVSELTLHAGAVFAEIFPSRPALAIEPWLAVHVCSAARRALAAARYQIAVPNFC